MKDSAEDLLWKLRYSQRMHIISIRYGAWQRMKFSRLKWWRRRDRNFLLGCEKALDQAWSNQANPLINEYLSVVKGH